MPRLLRLLGYVLVLLGVALWVATGRSQPTALIPAGFGVVFIALAHAARRPGVARSALRGGALLALVGAIGGFVKGMPGVISQLQGEAIPRPLAIWGQITMGVLCLAYVIIALTKGRARPGT